VFSEKGNFLLRPSLYAMSQLGGPEEIVRTYASVMNGNLMDSVGVLHACTEEDLSGVFGYYESTDSGTRYIPGRAPTEQLVLLAQCLVKHGVTGALVPLPRRAGEDPEFVTGFHVREHVAMAVAHLGIQEEAAWNMTMTSLVGALRAKFPLLEKDNPGAKAPTAEEHDATMEWFDKVEMVRKAAQGAH